VPDSLAGEMEMGVLAGQHRSCSWRTKGGSGTKSVSGQSVASLNKAKDLFGKMKKTTFDRKAV
jgi:hypothetical protein